MTKILTHQKFKGVGAVASGSRLNVVKTLNVGPHTHVELSGPSPELMTILAKNRVGQFGGLQYPDMF